MSPACSDLQLGAVPRPLSLAAPLLAAALAMLAADPPAVAAEGPVKAHDWGERMAKARGYARARAGRVSFSIRAPGLRRSHRGRTTYASASVVKVTLMAVYLRQRRDVALSGGERRALRRMIRRSDNAAATRIRDRVGNEALEAFARKVGMGCLATAPSWGSTRICSRDQALLMARLSKVLPRRHRGFALRQLRRIVPRQRWGIPEVTGWTPYFKGGWYEDAGGWRTHQIALLEAPDGRRLALAILSSGQPTRNYGRATIRGVAKRLIGPLTRR